MLRYIDKPQEGREKSAPRAPRARCLRLRQRLPARLHAAARVA